MAEKLITVIRNGVGIDIYDFCKCAIGDVLIDKNGKRNVIETVSPVNYKDFTDGCSIISKLDD